MIGPGYRIAERGHCIAGPLCMRWTCVGERVVAALEDFGVLIPTPSSTPVAFLYMLHRINVGVPT
jgi:hypothetical protein